MIKFSYDKYSNIYWGVSEKGHRIPLTEGQLQDLKENIDQLLAEAMQRDLDLGSFGCEGGGCII